MRVYLAGAITGRSYDQATGWRNIAKQVLFQNGIDCLDPMRGKEFLKDSDCILSSDGDPGDIFRQDMLDVAFSQILLCNFEGVSGIGTPFELGVAYSMKTPVLVFGLSPAQTQHPFILGNPNITVCLDLSTAIQTLLQRTKQPH